MARPRPRATRVQRRRVGRARLAGREIAAEAAGVSASPRSSSSSATRPRSAMRGPPGARSAAASTCGSTRTWPGTSTGAVGHPASCAGSASSSIEQPIAAADVAGLARLTARVRRRDHRRRGFHRPGLAADADQPPRLYRRQRADLQVRRPGRRGRPVPGRPSTPAWCSRSGARSASRRCCPRRTSRCCRRLAAADPGVRYAEGCFGTHLLREDPATPDRCSSASAAARRAARRAPASGSTVDEAILRRWAVGHGPASRSSSEGGDDMSRVGRLLLWTRAPSTLRRFAAGDRVPR